MKANIPTVLLTLTAFSLLGASTDLVAQSPYFPNFSTATNLQLNGNAAFCCNDTPNLIRLTPASTKQAGSAWFTIKQPVAGGFTTVFQFQMTSTDSPADGLAFVIQNMAPMVGAPYGGTRALAGVGGGIGYGVDPVNEENFSGISNALAIEFDTHQNPWDPDANHVAVQSCGTHPDTPDHTATYNDGQILCNLGLADSGQLGGVNLADGQTHTVRIDYTSPAECDCGGMLQVTLDGHDLFTNANENQITQLDLSSLLSLDIGGTAWVGFTGATGDAFENNDILSWTFTPHTSTSINQTINPGQTTIYTFGAYNYKITPNTGTNTGPDSLTITADLIDPDVFNNSPGVTTNFPGAKCIVYDGTGGKCVEFHAVCNSGPDCVTGTYELATSYDLPPNTPPITNPGLLDAPGVDCTPSTVFTKNIIDAFFQTRQDPTTRGSGGPGYNCFVAVQNVTYPSANLALGKFSGLYTKNGNNLSYAIGVVNLGPNSANGIVITDPLPPYTTFVSANFATVSCTLSGCSLPPPGATPCTFDSNSNSVTCDAVGTLAPFSLKSLTGIAVKLVVNVANAPVGSLIKNKATVTALNPDPQPANNSFTAVTKVTQ